MTVLASEILFRKPKTVTDTSANGGRMSFLQYVSGTAANVFGHAFAAERASGSTKYRKICVVVANDADETLYGAMLRLFMPTAGGDAISFHLGTARDTQGDITGSEPRFGVGTLYGAVSAGGATLVVDVESAALASGSGAIFRSGQKIFISDKATWSATSGNIEEHTIASVSVSGTRVTITLSGATLANGYAAWSSETRTGGFVMSAPNSVDLSPALSNYTHSVAGSGVLDTSKILIDSIGVAEMTVTGMFTDATHYTLTSDDTSISLGSGTTGADYSPNNSAVSKPFFTILASAFSGTFAAGDGFSFQVHPPAIYPWLRRDIPAGCNSLSGNQFVLIAQGETA